ncbi:YbjQ family protein [Fundidesulfovibrio terrae]|uniref:YbjQ family protein n=1 Tax=Fundidesulfovibrio terrae TaxID=2922866 RepID=UPI001FAE76CF|nr:YbjQ family protein [Fundidesulfovibrio terrae]
MLSLFTGAARQPKDPNEEVKRGQRLQHAKDMFYSGKLPVVTTPVMKGRPIKKVLGLVHGRGYDAECALLTLAASAMEIGGDAIIGYQESVAFHPDGSKFFSCYGTAVILEKPGTKAGRRSLTH